MSAYRDPAEREPDPPPPRKPIAWASVGVWVFGWGCCYLFAFAICYAMRETEGVAAWGCRVSLMFAAFGFPFVVRALK